MNNPRTEIRQLLPAIFIASPVAFAAGYLLNRLFDPPPEADNHTLFWLVTHGMLMVAAAILVFGQRQVAAMGRVIATREERERESRRAAWRQMAESVHQSLADLADQYEDTPQDRLQIHIAYHRDTFAALTAALAEVPVHELGSVDATVAWCGLKKNLRDVQYLANLYIARPLGNSLAPRSSARIDLRQCKAFADMHYTNFMRAMSS